MKSRKIATHQNHALISTSHHAMNRTPLGPINGNKTHRKELTPFTRGFILGKLTSGVTPPQIEREIHAPRSTIRSVLRASEWQKVPVNLAVAVLLLLQNELVDISYDMPEITLKLPIQSFVLPPISN